MTIKEFSHKHSLVFFWATIVLVVLFLLTACIGGKGRHMMMKKGYGYDHDRYEKRMMNKSGYEKQMMGPGKGQNMMNGSYENMDTIEVEAVSDTNISQEVQ